MAGLDEAARRVDLAVSELGAAVDALTALAPDPDRTRKHAAAAAASRVHGRFWPTVRSLFAAGER